MGKREAILEAYLGIAPRTSEEAVLRLLVELGIECVGADEGSLLVLDHGTNELVFAMTVGHAESEATLTGQRVPVGSGLTGLAAATREVQVGAPTFKSLKQRKRAAAADGHPAAVLAAPMLVRDEVVGVLTAASFRRGRRFTQDDASVYGKIAAVAGVVVDQHERLRTLEALGRRRPAGPRTPQQRLQMKIVERVARLTAGRPERLARIRDLLEAVEGLCRPHSL